ncbi:MAG: choice-of-anchor N protein [Proteobacteria bacterium]|nr:choice-of-anchor N protein [Pseudomonadota bacterium]MBU1709154.1 choice-of-anchor N protein [Pseudomonadota bacterium]
MLEKKFSKIIAILFVLTLGTLPVSPKAEAVPLLQIYMEGATYDSSTESWTIDSADPFKLWVIGNTGGSENKGPLSGVKLSAAVLTSELATGSISLSSTTTSVVTDPSIPVAPNLNTSDPYDNDGKIPLDSRGKALPSHGELGKAGVSFFEWSLGDLTLTDSPVGDFIGGFPSTFPATGQINVYTVTIAGFSRVHFDAYGFYNLGKKNNENIVAPFSHDAESHDVPEPGTLFLFGTGLVGLALIGKQKKK